MRANHAFHDVIYAAADAPYVEQVAKSARRAFMGQAAVGAGAAIDGLYARNDLGAPRDPRGDRRAKRRGRPSARPAARADSGELLLAILEQMASRRTRAARAP